MTDLNAISESSTMTEVLAAYPGARRALFRKYHIGGCQSCGFQPSETLGELCERNGALAVAEVLAEIRAGHEADRAMEILPAEVAERRTRGGALRLLDIRTREEFEAVRIDGAEFVDQAVVQELMSRAGKDEWLVFYDHTGGQSLDAAAYFVGHGFANAKCLRGGIDAWACEVDKTVRRYKLQA